MMFCVFVEADVANEPLRKFRVVRASFRQERAGVEFAANASTFTVAADVTTGATATFQANRFAVESGAATQDHGMTLT